MAESGRSRRWGDEPLRVPFSRSDEPDQLYENDTPCRQAEHRPRPYPSWSIEKNQPAHEIGVIAAPESHVAKPDPRRGAEHEQK